MDSEARKRATANYHRKCKRVLLVLNPDTDADVIESLEIAGNKSGYIKELIRRDIEKGEPKEGKSPYEWTYHPGCSANGYVNLPWCGECEFKDRCRW